MDQPCSFEDMRACLQSIERVNALTRGHYPTLHWLNHVYSVLPRQTYPLHIVDVGCGSGDFLRRIYRWAQDLKLPVRLTGIDLNPAAVRAAREITVPGTVTFLAGNVFDYHPQEGIDLVLSSLLTHHLEEPDIVQFLRWMEGNARLGWFINDLHRQAFPYYAFQVMARFSGWHPFVKHDGAVSILRGFRRNEWRLMLQAAAIPERSYIIREYRPARLCVARLR